MKFETAPPLEEREFRLFQQLFYQHIGLNLSDQKRMLVRGRLGKRLVELALGNFADYYRLITQSGQERERQHAIDLITTNETFFFREKKHFDLLAETIAPVARVQPLRVWSAACSSGEEPYSIAMVLHAALGDQRWQLLASDISERMLTAARRGLYKTDRLGGIPNAWLKRYCLRGTGPYEGYMLVDRILRERVEFLPINLMQIPVDMQGFDVIFLRNVIIYFDAETKAKVVREMFTRLRPGGWLFLGHSESLAGIKVSAQQIGPSIYRRPEATR